MEPDDRSADSTKPAPGWPVAPPPGSLRPGACSSAVGRGIGVLLIALLFAPWWPTWTPDRRSESGAECLAIGVSGLVATDNAAFERSSDAVSQTLLSVHYRLVAAAFGAIALGALGLVVLPRRPARAWRLDAALAALGGYGAIYTSWCWTAATARIASMHHERAADEAYLVGFVISFAPIVAVAALAWGVRRSSDGAHWLAIAGSVVVGLTALPCTWGGWGAHASALLIAIALWRELAGYDESRLWVSADEEPVTP